MNAKIVQLLTMESQNTSNFSKLTRELGKQDINILGFTGIAQNGNKMTSLLVEDPEQARTVLDGEGMDVRLEEAIAIQTPHKPGVAGQLTGSLEQKEINLNKTFPFVEEGGRQSGLVFQTPDSQSAKSLLDQQSKQTAGVK